jgi:hypothetical protein
MKHIEGRDNLKRRRDNCEVASPASSHEVVGRCKWEGRHVRKGA